MKYWQLIIYWITCGVVGGCIFAHYPTLLCGASLLVFALGVGLVVAVLAASVL